MFQNTKRGDIVKIPTDNGDAWAKVLNDEPKEGTVLVITKERKMLHIPKDDIFDQLRKGPCED